MSTNLKIVAVSALVSTLIVAGSWIYARSGQKSVGAPIGAATIPMPATSITTAEPKPAASPDINEKFEFYNLPKYITSTDPEDPQYMVGQDYPLCGETELVVKAQAPEEGELKLPSCTEITGDLQTSTAIYGRIIAIKDGRVEFNLSSLELRGKELDGFASWAPKYSISKAELKTPTAIVRNGKRWPLPFLRAHRVKNSVYGTLEWCDSGSEYDLNLSVGDYVESLTSPATEEDCRT